MNDIEMELRRGLTQIAVLALAGVETYGYDLAKRMGEKGFPVEEGTLYPLMRRLEERGLLQSNWNTEGPRPRKYYRTTEDGRRTLAELKVIWDQYNCVVGEIIEEGLS